VKKIRVDQGPGTDSWLASQAFSHLDLRYFSAFANVHALDLENMQIYRFIPGTERYLEHLTRQRYDPSHCPIHTAVPPNNYHISSPFFQIWNTHKYPPDTTTPERDLTPFSTPNLRGQLVLCDSNWAETWTCLTTSCGGPRFHHMELRECASCAPVLFEACAETLETLRFSARDSSLSEWFRVGLFTDLS